MFQCSRAAPVLPRMRAFIWHGLSLHIHLIRTHLSKHRNTSHIYTCTSTQDKCVQCECLQCVLLLCWYWLNKARHQLAYQHPPGIYTRPTTDIAARHLTLTIISPKCLVVCVCVYVCYPMNGWMRSDKVLLSFGKRTDKVCVQCEVCLCPVVFVYHLLCDDLNHSPPAFFWRVIDLPVFQHVNKMIPTCSTSC